MDMKVPIASRQQLLAQIPCFSNMTQTQLIELAKHFHEINFDINTQIVKQDELIDSIYIIVTGSAEVTRMQPQRKKMIQIPVAMLSEGEAIGLNDTGFYSKTGKRTATVTALSKMLLLRLDIKDLYLFLKKNNLELSMHAASKKMLCMRFIKQSLPFAKLSHERLAWLAEHVEEITIPANTLIFKQGDVGDKCYLIRSGEVEITITDPSGEERQVAKLKSPTLFGEATLITKTPRNATARTLSDSEFFVLSQSHLLELIESEKNVANMFMTLMVDRSRPIKNPIVTSHQRITPDGQITTILKNPDNQSYFKLSAEGIFIWEQLDGHHTLQEITLDLAKTHHLFAPDVVAALISKLSKNDFILNVETHYDTNDAEQSLLLRIWTYIKKIIDRRIAFGDADPILTWIYHKYVRYVYTKLGQMILAIIAISGFVLFILHTPNILNFFSHNKISWLLLFSLIPFSLLEVILHELGHAFTAKAFGHEVHYVGVGWYWFIPIAFVDTSDMWLATRKPRMLVNFAGIYVDVLIAGIAALLIAMIANPYIEGMLWLFALYTYIGGFRMLSPLQELDGYYILRDWLEKNKLRHSAVLWLVRKFPKSLKHPKLFKQNKAEISYWMACIIFLILTTIVTLTIQKFIFKVLGINTVNPYLILILPFIVIIVSSLRVINDIRNQAEKY